MCLHSAQRMHALCTNYVRARIFFVLFFSNTRRLSHTHTHIQTVQTTWPSYSRVAELSNWVKYIYAYIILYRVPHTHVCVCVWIWMMVHAALYILLPYAYITIGNIQRKRDECGPEPLHQLTYSQTAFLFPFFSVAPFIVFYITKDENEVSKRLFCSYSFFALCLAL